MGGTHVVVDVGERAAHLLRGRGRVHSQRTLLFSISIILVFFFFCQTESQIKVWALLVCGLIVYEGFPWHHTKVFAPC